MDSSHRPWTARLWSPYRSSYADSISVIEKPDSEKKKESEESEDIKKVPFGFGRVLEDS